MNLIRTSCIRIPQQFESEEWCKNILRDLTRTGTSFEDPSVKVTSVFYEKRDGHICIPRFYPIENYGHKVIDYITDGEDINIDFKSEWRSDLQIQSFNMMTTENKGILKLLPGEGKTVISIGSICKLKKKAIIFVHKDSLATQWKERFLQHTNITEDQIGLLSTADRFDVLQKDIVISTVQTMNSMIERVPDFEKLFADANFGIAVWDECHTSTGAITYSRSSLFLPCKRVFGLSATPQRSDGHHDIIALHLGQLFEPEGKSATMNPKIVILYFDHKVISNHKKYVYWGIPGKDGTFKLKFPQFDTSRYLAMLTSKKNDAYIPIMKKVVKQIYDSGRIALMISDRIKVLDMVSCVIPNKNDVGFFIPRSGKLRDSELLKPFVFSTPGSARDGTDRPEFDTLIMSNRISNIEQAIGRICRPKPNKKQPVVFDVVDMGCEELMKSVGRRKEFYTQRGWVIEEKFLK
jgi:hypothetical protein